jgi:hypothetical protein
MKRRRKRFPLLKTTFLWSLSKLWTLVLTFLPIWSPLRPLVLLGPLQNAPPLLKTRQSLHPSLGMLRILPLRLRPLKSPHPEDPLESWLPKKVHCRRRWSHQSKCIAGHFTPHGDYSIYSRKICFDEWKKENSGVEDEEFGAYWKQLSNHAKRVSHSFILSLYQLTRKSPCHLEIHRKSQETCKSLLYLSTSRF